MKIEEIGVGIKTETVNGIDYVVCPLNTDTKVADYLAGKVPCVKFRLPAVKSGISENGDGLYQLYEIVYNVVDGNEGKVQMDGVALVEDAFYDADKKRVCAPFDEDIRFDDKGCYISRDKRDDKYAWAMWNFFLDVDNATGK